MSSKFRYRWCFGRWIKETLEDGRERQIPEVFEQNLTDGHSLEFRLADEAEVFIPDDPYEPKRGFQGRWGDLKHDLPFTIGYEPFVVEVLKGIWHCDAKAVADYIAELQDTISRRNRQIEALRKEYKKLRERLASLSEKTEPARS
jgi:hypothetical protein